MNHIAVIDPRDLRAMIAEQTAATTAETIRTVLARRTPSFTPEIIDIRGAGQLLGRTDRQIRTAVRNGTCPAPVVGGANTSSWRWSTAQFLTPDPSTPARCESGAAANTAGGSPTIKQEADPK